MTSNLDSSKIKKNKTIFFVFFEEQPEYFFNSMYIDITSEETIKAGFCELREKMKDFVAIDFHGVDSDSVDATLKIEIDKTKERFQK